MPSFLVGFVPLTLLPRGRCWSKRSFTTTLLIVPNQEVIEEIKLEIWHRANRKKGSGGNTQSDRMSAEGDPAHPLPPLVIHLPPKHDIESMDVWNVIMLERLVMQIATQSEASILWSGKYDIQSNSYISFIKVVGVVWFHAAMVGEIHAWSHLRDSTVWEDHAHCLLNLSFWCWGVELILWEENQNTSDEIKALVS